MARLNKFKDKCILLLTTITIIISKYIEAHRLNVPRVLLPVFNDFPVNFTLEVTEGGCYKWSSSRLDLVRLVPIYENNDRKCSSAVLVQTVTKESTRNTVIVLAEDINTGQFLRCDVIVDAIFSFNLVTTTRELFIEEAPEAFEVRAYDEQGNEFTTLAGIEFTWTIGNTDKHGLLMENKPLNNVLRFMTFQESPYETPPTVAELDSLRKKGHITLLEGIRTGSAKVSVRLSHAEYRHVPPIEVELIVVANLIILPSDVTMMAYDGINYRIMQVHQGRLEEISLPSDQYYLEAENPDILEINNDRGTAYALGRGKTKVFLHDRNVDEDYGVVLPSATVNVNEPAYITLTVLPHRNWGLILGNTHEIVVEIYDSKDHRIHLGEGVEVDVKIDEKYLNVDSKTQNGTHIVATPVATGTTIVEATLIGIINNKGKRVSSTPRLSTTAELAIHPPVSVTPKTLAVPWDRRSKPRFEVALTASGGDGAYMWTSQHPSVALVSQNGVVGILQGGFARIIVSMIRNQHNQAETKVHALIPSRLEIIEYNMEAAVGESIHIHVAMYGQMKEGINEAYEIPFNDCSDIPLDVYIPDGNFVRNNSEKVESIGIACTTLLVVGLKVGVSSVTVAYSNNGQYLKDNVTISAYEPLKVVHPSSGDTRLAVGSSRHLVFKGGPLPWSGKHQSYQKEMKISNLGVLRFAEQEYPQNGPSDVYVYDVICEALGETVLTLAVSNVPILPNCRQTDATASVIVSCAKPRHINLISEFKDSENCPMNNSTDHVMARSGKSFELTVVVRDEDGRPFDNVTSLNVEWALGPADYGSVEKVLGVMEETYQDMQVTLPMRHYQRILPKQQTGMLEVNARVTGYQKRVLARLGIVPERPSFPTQTEKGTIETPVIKASINITLVNDTVIQPNNLKVLNDPNINYSMHVSQGSGFYEFVLSSEDIARVRYVEFARTITVVPINSGVLHLSLVDLCLPSNPAKAVIEVQQLGGIQVEAIDKVEIDKCIVAAVKLYDTNGRAMEIPSIDAMSIKTYVDNKRIEVKRLPKSEQGNPPYEQILYKINGVEEGESQLSFGSGKDEQEIRSESVTIQVFLPLKITPRNATILVGSLYQLATVGGPSNSEIEFISDNEDILDVSSNGMLDSKTFGTAVVSAIAVGLTPNGKRIIHSNDSVEVRVVPLEGIKIVAPTVRIKVGGTLPLWAFGIPEQLTPLVIGSMKTRMRFSWSTNDQSEVLKLKNMYDGTGINIGYDDEVSVRVSGLQPGTAVVHLNVTTPCSVFARYNKKTTYSAFLKIEVFQELHLLGLGNNDGYGRPIVLMTPNSVFKLQTNRDKYGLTTYNVLSQGNTGEIENTNALTKLSKSVTVDKNGLVKSGDTLGRTILSITSAEAMKQTLTIVVEVKPIHYMMLMLKSEVRVRAGEELDSLPRGMELDYIVEYYDNFGTKFNAAETKLSVLTNRANLASFNPSEKNKISVKFMHNGNMIAKIHNEKYPNGMFDYVNMAIGDILFPSKTTLTVGDVVCFSMPLLSNDGDLGSWQSSNLELLTIDSISGVGRALSPGHVRVKHSLAALAQGEIQLDIKPVSEITFVPSQGRNVTGTEVFSLPLILKSTGSGQEKSNNILARGENGCRTRYNFGLNIFPFACTVSFSKAVSSVNIKDLFLVKPRFDMKTGFYYCDVVPMGSPSKATSTLDITLSIGAQLRDVEATPVLVPFLPAVYIPAKEIVFPITPASSSPSAIIQVHGISTVLTQLAIHLPEGLALVTESQSVRDTIAQFKIRMTHNQDELQGSHIRVISEITKQDIHILVRVSKYNQAVPITGINWLDYIYYHRYTFGTFVALVVTFFYIYGNKITSISVSVKNKSIFAEKCPPPMKKTYASSSPSDNNATSTPSPGSLNTSLRPFSAFEPVYGDPRGFYTPNARRNQSFFNS